MVRVAFIVNPISGRSKKEQILAEIERRFTRERGFDVALHKTTGRGDATLAAAGFARQFYDIVVAVGGDGTVNEVACGLVHTKSALAIVPAGSGNGLARHFGIPMGYKEALSIVEKGCSYKLDAGKVNGKYFFCTAGVGFEAIVGEQFNRASSRGLVTYIKVCAKVFWNYRREKYRIEMLGRSREERAFLITFANCNQWGNNVYIAPYADASDGMLDIILWHRAPRRYFWLWGFQLLFKRMKRSAFADAYRIGSLSVEREQEGPVQLDGDAVVMPAKLDIGVVHNALAIIAPQKS